MTISEPTTVATDYLLTALGVWWGLASWRLGIRRGQRSPRLFGAAFLAMSAGAALGGTAHGFAQALDEVALGSIWRATTISLGIAGYLLLCGTVTATVRGLPGRIILGLGGLQLGVYVVWMMRHREFYWVILQYGSSMLVVAALMGWLAARKQAVERVAALWVLGGIALSVVGAAVQAGGLSLHRHFNHNDLYHVIQMAALYGFYRGGRRLVDARGEGSRP